MVLMIQIKTDRRPSLAHIHQRLFLFVVILQSRLTQEFYQPVRYAFEAIITNEFHTLDGKCSSLVPQGPGYEGVALANQVCTTVGSQPGQSTVNGNRFVELSYGYSYSNLWRVSPSLTLICSAVLPNVVELRDHHRVWGAVHWRLLVLHRTQCPRGQLDVYHVVQTGFQIRGNF